MNPLTYAKIGITIAALAAITWFAVLVGNWHRDAGRMHAAEADRDRIAAESAQAMQTMATQLRASYAASEGYQNELSTLRSTARSIGPVRVCRTAPASVPAGTAATGRPDAAGAPAGVVPAATGGDPGISRDIGPDLAALADAGDQCSAQLRGLQAWVTATRQ